MHQIYAFLLSIATNVLHSKRNHYEPNRRGITDPTALQRAV